MPGVAAVRVIPGVSMSGLLVPGPQSLPPQVPVGNSAPLDWGIPAALRYPVAMSSRPSEKTAMVGAAAVSLYPRLVPSRTDLTYSLTAYDASSSDRTLLVMLVIALIGMPLVIGYTAFVYRAFKGRVVLGEDSY